MNRHLLAKLLSWKAKPTRKPLLIDGARQTGKTWLLKNLLGKEFGRVLHLDFVENPGLAEIFEGSLSPKVLVPKIELHANQAFNPGQDLLILDEVGECQRALTSLKYFAEQVPAWFVAASGSNIGLLRSFPVGKVEQHCLRPMTFAEFIQASGNALLIKAFEAQDNSAVAHTRLSDQLTDYYFTGGMPEAVCEWFAQPDGSLLQRTEAVAQIHQNLLECYRKDFGKYAGKANPQLIESVFNAIPAQLSAVVDESVKRFRFKGVHPRKERYADFATAIDWLHKSLLVLPNYPLEGKLRSPLAAYRKPNMVKLFLFDVGLLNRMLGTSYSEIKEQSYEYKGYVAENFVRQELAAMGMEPSYSWQNARAEIEFVLSNDRGEVIPVEVKSGRRTRAKSLRAYMDKYKPPLAIKLTGARARQPNTANKQTPITLPLHYVQCLRDYKS